MIKSKANARYLYPAVQKALCRRKTYREINSTHISSIIRLILVLCLQVSVSLCQLPVTGISTASATPGTGAASINADDLLRIFLSEQLTTAGNKRYFLGSNKGADKTNYIFTENENLMGSIVSTNDKPAFVFLKDPLKLYRGVLDQLQIEEFKVAYSAGTPGTMALSLNGVFSTIDFPVEGMTEEFTPYLYIVNKAKNIIKISINPIWTSSTTTASVVLGGSAELSNRMYLMHSGNDVICLGPMYSISTKSNLVQVTAQKSVPSPAKYWFRDFNAANGEVYYGVKDQSTCELYRNVVTSGLMTKTHTFTSGTYGKGSMVDFGPYQYVIYFGKDELGGKVWLLNKLDLTEDPGGYSFTIPLAATQGVKEDTASEFMMIGNRSYFAVNARGAKSFQSYYLTVDLCTQRVSSVCQRCLTGYMVKDQTANNICITESTTPPAQYGFDVAWPTGTGANTKRVLPCSDLNCNTCTTTYTTCTVCKANYYLNTQNSTPVCQHKTLNPIIPDGLGVVLSVSPARVAACSVTQCSKCKDDNSVCTECNFASGWNLNTATNQCQHATISPIIPDFFGINLSAKTVVSCQKSNCKDCKADFTGCTGCNTASSWYLDTNTTTCQHPTSSPTIPDFNGANLSTGKVSLCSTPNCKFCKLNHTTCIGCDKILGWYLHTPTGTCYHKTFNPTIPATYGPPASGNTLVKCQDIHCQNCSNTYATCITCASGYLLSLDGFTCLSNCPSGQGTKTANMLVNCDDIHCKDCCTDYTICTDCYFTSGWYLNGVSCQHAINSPKFPVSFGPDTVSRKVVACADTHCTKCTTSYSTCTVCDTGNGWYLNDITCQHASIFPTFPPSFGPNTATGLAQACSAAFCLTCSQSFDQCADCQSSLGRTVVLNMCVCDTSNQYYLDTATSTCKHTSSLVDSRQGGDSTTGEVKSCIDTHCLNCNVDVRVCTVCDTLANYYRNESECLNAGMLNDGYGFNVTLGTVEKCSVEHCLNCRPDLKKCEKCDAKSGYVENQGNCTFKPAAAELNSALFFAKTSQAEVLFPESMKSRSQIAEPLEIVFMDNVKNKDYGCREIKCQIAKITDKGFIIQFDSPIEITEGELFIKTSATLNIIFDNGAVWMKYPIRVADVVFLAKRNNTDVAKSTATDVATSAANTMNQLRTPISIFISFISPAAASFIDMLMNILFLLKLIEGPSVSYPDAILNADYELKLLPIDVRNPLESWINSDAAECTPSEQFIKHDIACNLLSNEGSQLIQIFGMLLFTIIITYLSNQLLRYAIKRVLRHNMNEPVAHELVNQADDRCESEKKIDSRDGEFTKVEIDIATKASKIVRLIKKFRSVLGVRFFVSKLDGNQIELTAMSMLALRHTFRTASGVLSTLMAIAVLAYYAVIAALSFRMTIWLWQQIEIKKKDSKSEQCKGAIADYIDMSQSPHPVLNYAFEEMRMPDAYWKLLLPVVTYLISSALCIVVTCLIGSPKDQTIVSALIILGALVFEVAARPRHRRSEQLANIIMYALTLIYLIMKCITTAELSEQTRQFNLGYPMMVALILLILTAILFAVITIGIMIFESIKKLIAKCRACKKPKDAVNKDNQDQSAILPNNVSQAMLIVSNSIANPQPSISNSQRMRIHPEQNARPRVLTRDVQIELPFEVPKKMMPRPRTIKKEVNKAENSKKAIHLENGEYDIDRIKQVDEFDEQDVSPDILPGSNIHVDCELQKDRLNPHTRKVRKYLKHRL